MPSTDYTGTMMRLTVGQALVRYLAAQFTERDGRRRRLVPAVFGILGHGNASGLGEALAREDLRSPIAEHLGAVDRTVVSPDAQRSARSLPFLQGRNEQSMVHAAAAFAREHRRCSALAVTASIGPGSTNLVTGAALATVDRLPVLLLPSDAYSTRRQGNVLQQLEHPGAGDVTVNDCLRPVSRSFDRILLPDQLLTALPEAMRVLTSPVETGAVTIALPQDVQSRAAEFPAAFFEDRVWRIERPAPDHVRVAEVVELLRTSRRPVIVAGGGVVYSDAEEALEAFSAAVGIPVVETFSGKGAMQHDSWRLLGGVGVEGNPAANAVASRADVVLAVGTRLGDFITASRSLFIDPAVQFIGINLVAHDAAKLGGTPVVADARATLEILLEAARTGGLRTSVGYAEEVAGLKTSWRARRAAAVDPAAGDELTSGQVIGVLNARARAGDVVVTAAGAPPGDLLKIWDAFGDRRCHLEFGYSCMGYEVPGGIGTRLARPDGEVVVLVGDGSFLMAPGELVTALQEHLAVTIVILDNHGYQVIRRLQMARVGEGFATEFRERTAPLLLDGEGPVAALGGAYLPLDLAAVARGLGARAWSVRTVPDLTEALEAARQVEGPAVVVADVAPHRDLPGSDAWWDVAPAEVSDDPTTRSLRAAYEGERRDRARFYF